MDRRHSLSDSFADFLSAAKYYILACLAVIVVAGGLVLFAIFYNARYNEKAVAMLERTSENYDALISSIQKKTEPNTAQAGSAQSAGEQSGDEDIAQSSAEMITALDAIIQEYPKSFAAQKALFQKGRLYFYEEKYPEALSEFLRAAEQKNKKRSYLTPIAYFYAAVAAENAGSDAAPYYQRIVDQYPKSITAAHAYFSLGRLAEANTPDADTSKARSFYETFVNDPTWKDSSWASLAQSRLAALNQKNNAGGTNSAQQTAAGAQ